MARTVSTQTPIDVEFSPFFSMHRRTYAAYWDVLTPAELDGAGARARRRARARCARSRRRRSRRCRSAIANRRRNSISRVWKRRSSAPMAAAAAARSSGSRTTCRVERADAWSTLVATYNSDQRRPRSFDVLVDGQKVGVRVAAAKQPVASSTKRNTRFPRS